MLTDAPSLGEWDEPWGPGNQSDNSTEPSISENKVFMAFLVIFYAAVFILGMGGNILVMVVVLKNKQMREYSTNLFIANMALANVLLCTFSLPITPLPVYMEWSLGPVVCSLLPVVMAGSVFISTYVAMAIAIDRYIQIALPFHPKMSVQKCMLINAVIVTLSLGVSLPFGLLTKVEMGLDGQLECKDTMSGTPKRVVSICQFVCQYIVPGTVISTCYARVSLILTAKAAAKRSHGMVSKEREDMEAKRNSRTNKMLIMMIAIFMVCWLPWNIVLFATDYSEWFASTEASTVCFLISHWLAMSSTVYNPLLYGWMNDNVRREFLKTMPCLEKLCACCQTKQAADDAQRLRGQPSSSTKRVAPPELPTPSAGPSQSLTPVSHDQQSLLATTDDHQV